jgi:hypothetical protein
VTVLGGAWACGGDSSPSSPSGGGTTTTPTLTKPTLDTPAEGAQLDTKRPTLTVNNGTSNQTSPAKTYEFQISDNAGFTATASFNAWFALTVTQTAVPEGSSGKTSFTPTQDLQPTTKYYWRVRTVQGTTNSEWSETRSFKTKLEGYNRPGELYDPLIHGETVGTIVGSATWLPGRGIRLNDKFSYVRYKLPAVVTDGEYSMDVEGLAANAPGDKAKVFGMADDDGSSSFDFVTNMWRVDIQYRGTTGVPPNCIQWRAMFGDDSHKIEPATEVRFRNVFPLDPSTTYYFRATWGSMTGSGNGFRVQVREGGMNGREFYNEWAETSATYRPPNPTAYLGTPIGRSGAESATIAGSIFRNVWLGNKPRPSSLGSALELER